MKKLIVVIAALVVSMIGFSVPAHAVDSLELPTVGADDNGVNHVRLPDSAPTGVSYFIYDAQTGRSDTSPATCGWVRTFAYVKPGTSVNQGGYDYAVYATGWPLKKIPGLYTTQVYLGDCPDLQAENDRLTLELETSQEKVAEMRLGIAEQTSRINALEDEVADLEAQLAAQRLAQPAPVVKTKVVTLTKDSRGRVVKRTVTWQ